jgi:hypothetical protein
MYAVHECNLALLRMTDRVRHDHQARIALAAKQRIRHRDRSLMMPGHQINEQPVKGRSLDRLKFREVSRV